MPGSSGAVVRLAVLSDSHASSEDPTKTTSASTWVRKDETEGRENPLAGLAEFIDKTDELRADVLLCPGDLCDQADWDALPYAWEQLQDLAAHLGAEETVATVGNHDIDSHDKRGAATVEAGLRGLVPHFPTVSTTPVTPFWDERICVVTGTDWRVVSLNSSLMRKLDTANNERDHGTVEDPTLYRLQALIEDDTHEINVLLCHHHPLPSTHLDPRDQSQMQNGDRLVRLLDDLPHHWLVVHGHKHEPHLGYLGGTGDAPIRLAAGSVGANLWGTLGAHVRNQIHLVEIPVDPAARANLTLAGRVRSWTWQPRTGWRQAIPGEGLPARAGFGHSTSGVTVARDVVQWAQSQGLNVISRDALIHKEPKLPYLLPEDLSRFISEVEGPLRGRVSLDSNYEIERIVLP